MKKILNLKVLLVFGLIFTFTSCTKDWEEMNTNPNEPTEAPATNILAYSLRYCGDSFFDDWMGMNNFLSYGGQVSKIQYIDESRYQFRESVVNNAWRDMYLTMLDLKKAQELAAAQGNPNLQAAAMTFQVYMMQMATDMWRDIPYSDALQGEAGMTNPKYDSQQSIYMGMINQLAEAADLFDPGSITVETDLGEGDLLFSEDPSTAVIKWQKFCNSLRLRIAIRISDVDAATAGSIFSKVFGDPAKYPVMSSNDDNAFLWWPGAAPYKEPWQENSQTRDDHGMCNTLIDTLKGLADPRLPVYAHPNPDGEYVGVPAGAIDGSFDMANISRIGARFRDDAAGFTPFMRYCEVEFYKAEAAMKGFNNGGVSAEDAYVAGITASMEENGIEQADIDTYLANPAVAWNNDINQIYFQKWISIFKEGEEVWAECRRTDVPLMGEAVGSPYQSHNRPPFRYPYPTSEYNLNSANINAVTDNAGIVDYFWGQQMWWDVRSNVH